MAKNIVALLIVAGALLLPRPAVTAEKFTPPGASPAALSGALPGPGQVALLQADLVVTEIKFDHVTVSEYLKPKVCYNFYYGYTIKNQGNASSVGTQVLEEVTAMNTGHYTLFGNGCVGPLGPGASYTRTPQPVSAQNWCVGDPYKVKVKITVDPPDAAHPRGAVIESDETHNWLEREFKPPIAVTPPLPQKKL